jgi:hypothetical protein
MAAKMEVNGPEPAKKTTDVNTLAIEFYDFALYIEMNK